jgi:hypothetical protein
VLSRNAGLLELDQGRHAANASLHGIRERRAGLVATWGGGAERVGEAQARQFLRDGQVFRPVLDNGCFRPAGRGTLSWAMYYRQSAMFVSYLGEDAPALRKPWNACARATAWGRLCTPRTNSPWRRCGNSGARMTRLHPARQGRDKAATPPRSPRPHRLPAST